MKNIAPRIRRNHRLPMITAAIIFVGLLSSCSEEPCGTSFIKGDIVTHKVMNGNFIVLGNAFRANGECRVLVRNQYGKKYYMWLEELVGKH